MSTQNHKNVERRLVDNKEKKEQAGIFEDSFRLRVSSIDLGVAVCMAILDKFPDLREHPMVKSYFERLEVLKDLHPEVKQGIDY